MHNTAHQNCPRFICGWLPSNEPYTRVLYGGEMFLKDTVPPLYKMKYYTKRNNIHG